MGSATIQYNGSDDQFAKISNTTICRTLDVGNDWNWLRIGIRWCISGSGVIITDYPRTAIGLSHGNASFTGNTSAANHFVGLWGQDDATGTGQPSTYPWGLYDWFNIPGGGTNYVNTWKVENGVSTLLDHQYPGYPYARSPQVYAYPNRSFTMVEYKKGSPNWSFSSWHMWFANGDENLDTLTKWCYQASPDTATPSNYLPVSSTFAVDEGTFGALDTFCFYWSPTTHTACVSDIIISKHG